MSTSPPVAKTRGKLVLWEYAVIGTLFKAVKSTTFWTAQKYAKGSGRSPAGVHAWLCRTVLIFTWKLDCVVPDLGVGSFSHCPDYLSTKSCCNIWLVIRTILFITRQLSSSPLDGVLVSGAPINGRRNVNLDITLGELFEELCIICSLRCILTEDNVIVYFKGAYTMGGEFNLQG